MVKKLVGKRHVSGTSRAGKEYDFWELYFIDSSDLPGLEGFRTENAIVQRGLDVSSVPINKDYDVATFTNSNGRTVCNLLYPVEK